jgi:hypothetical protein
LEKILLQLESRSCYSFRSITSGAGMEKGPSDGQEIVFQIGFKRFLLHRLARNGGGCFAFD